MQTSRNNEFERTPSLAEAFHTLRLRGFKTIEGQICCQGCGLAELTNEIENADNQEAIKGVVFFHEQDLEYYGNNDQWLHLSYDGWGEVNQQSAGFMIIRALCEVNLEWEWDGSVARRIRVNVGQPAYFFQENDDYWGDKVSR